MTLIEVMVALIMLAIALGALLAAVIAGLKSMQQSEGRSRANQVAAQQIEHLQTIAWSQLGLYGDDPDYAALDPIHGESVVTLASSTPSPAPSDLLRVEKSLTDGQVTYNVTTWVTWQGSSLSAPNDGTTYAAKRLYVRLDWNQNGTAKTLETTGLRAPTPTEMRAPSATTTGTPIAITSASASPNQTLSSGLTTSAITLLVDTSAPAQSVSASWTTSDGTPGSLAMTGDATGQHWTATIPAGTGPFSAGTLPISISALNSSGTTASATASVSLSSAAAGFQLSNASATPTSTTLDATHKTTTAITVAVQASAPALNVSIQYRLADGSQSGVLSMFYDVVTSSWEYILPAGSGPFPTGNVSFTMSATVNGQSSTASAAVTLAAPVLSAPTITNISASPSKVCVESSKLNTYGPVTFTVEVKNVAQNDTVTVYFDQLGVYLTTSTGRNGTNGGVLFDVSLPAGTNVPTTSLDVRSHAVRALDGATADYTLPFDVVSKNKSNGCPK